MKSKIMILANLLQKIALWKTEFNRSLEIEHHTRSINDIINDKDYELSPNEYFKKYK